LTRRSWGFCELSVLSAFPKNNVRGCEKHTTDGDPLWKAQGIADANTGVAETDLPLLFAAAAPPNLATTHRNLLEYLGCSKKDWGEKDKRFEDLFTYLKDLMTRWVDRGRFRAGCSVRGRLCTK
jgi:hypothetical protein